MKYGAPIPTRGMVSEQRNELKARVRDAIARGYDPAFRSTPGAAYTGTETNSSRVATQPSMRSSA